MPSGGTLHIEEIQDQVELQLMRNEEYIVARKYILYREERASERTKETSQQTTLEAPAISVRRSLAPRQRLIRQGAPNTAMHAVGPLGWPAETPHSGFAM